MDCKWGSWGMWSACTPTCGNRTQGASRDALQNAEGGGMACEGMATRSRSCENVKCPGMFILY